MKCSVCSSEFSQKKSTQKLCSNACRHQDARKPRIPSLLDRFCTRVSIGDGCWEWQGKHTKTGYGQLYVSGGKLNPKIRAAHRVSWELFHGDIGDKQVLHRCDNRGCVRPDHLFLGTQIDNIRDMVKKDRHSKTMTVEQVQWIRQNFKGGWNNAKKIASDFGVSWQTIYAVAGGRDWNGIT